MAPMALDDAAKKTWAERLGLPVSLCFPVAARDEARIAQLVGDVVEILAPGSPNKALLIRAHAVAIDEQLPIWRLPSSRMLNPPLQVWVHVDYPAYRSAYKRAFPDEDLTGRVLDHVRNRRVARLQGFQYLRIVPISRGANSSSGWTTESLYEMEYKRKNKGGEAPVDYTDLADLVKMLDLKTGGALQDGVNEAQRLVRPP